MKTNQTMPNRRSMFSVRRWMLNVALTLLLVSSTSVSAATRYVWQDSPSPGSPHTNWTTAAHVIQDAVDAALAGDEIVVTNGTYATGGRAVGTNVLVNRVAVDKLLALRSINGPELTVIQGYQVPGTTNGDGAIRCVYLADGASLSGFTLTHGATRSVYDDYPTYRESRGGGVWCESTNAAVTNCIITGNSAENDGGGAYGGTLNNCTLTGNSARWGGGVDQGRLNNCTLSGNSAGHGGGASSSTLNNCTLTGNSAAQSGGGAFVGTLNNCMLTGNSADHGGGTYGGTLNNCTVTGNFASSGGGVVNSELGLRLNNCIVYFNTALSWANYESVTEMNYCCTTPLPVPQSWQEPFVGNISLNPQLSDAAHLSAGSPCRGAGSAAYTTGTDIDGEVWATPPSIGCDEYHAGKVTGPLSVCAVADYTNAAVGFTVRLTALIEGRASLSMWEFGDGLALTNQPYTSHTWSALGDYAVVLRVYNESNPGGVSATVTVHVAAQPVHYVAGENSNPLPPYTSWETAATNIQDAVDVAVAGGTVLVTNGIYATGGRAVYGTMTNRVAVDRPLMLRSVNGPQYTVIQGYQVPGSTNGYGAIRCVYLANVASLSGFTLTNGATRSVYDDGPMDRELSGGGVWCELPTAVVSNCVVAGNSAESGGGAYGGTLNNCTLTANSAGYSGGGADGCRLNNCTLTGNSAGFSGGGAEDSTLYNCTLSGNSAFHGGGVSSCTLNNCILYFNSAPNGANYGSCDLYYCCTTPMPTNGVGNITNAPLFVDYAGGNLRLQSNSPCINAGLNAYASGSTDLDGNPRIVSGTVDIGAYEFQGLGSVISYAWLQHYGLPTDGSADATDPDADGHTNWQEWRCQTDPANAFSALRLLSACRAGTNVTVTWQSVAGVNYFLERATNMSSSPLFSTFATDIPGQPGTTTFTDTNAAAFSPLFYRVGVSWQKPE